MVGSWVELCGLVCWYVVDDGGHLRWMLLLCRSSYRVQFGHMLCVASVACEACVVGVWDWGGRFCLEEVTLVALQGVSW